MNADVAFEIDHFGEEEASSIVVRGRARQLEGHEEEEIDELPLRPWVNTAKCNTIAIIVDEVTGRHFELPYRAAHAPSRGRLTSVCDPPHRGRDWAAFYPVFREMVAAGETYAYPRA